MASTKSVNRREEFAASAEDVNGREGFSNTSLVYIVNFHIRENQDGEPHPPPPGVKI